jgi:hypothetical protein
MEREPAYRSGVSARLSRAFDTLAVVSPIRRDADGRIEIGRSWESLAERQIREALEGGAFDDLPYRGKRLPLEGREDEWWLAHNLLKQHGAAPAWIEADRDARALLDRRGALLKRAGRSRSAIARDRDRAELTALVRDINTVVFRLNYEAPTMAQHRPLLDPAAELAALATIHRRARGEPEADGPRRDP